MITMTKATLVLFMAEFAELHQFLMDGHNDEAQKLARSLHSDLASMDFSDDEMPDFVIMAM